MAQVSGSPAKPPSIEPMLRSATTRRSLPCPVTHGYTLFAAHVSVRRTWGVGARWHKVRKILNMVTTSGKRWWLVAWDSRDELGRPWPDTWEPTAYVLKDLRDHWFAEGAARVERSIQVDVRPLDILVQRTIATAMIKDTIDTFGKVHCIEVGALTLRDLADYYLNRVHERFELERQSVFGLGGATDRVTMDEVRIKEPNDLGDFCDFKTIIERGAEKNFRHRCGRAQDSTIVAVGVIYLRYLDNKLVPGTGTFEVEFHTVIYNGATGHGQPPHLGQESTSPLKNLDHRRAVQQYVRNHLPESHPLAVHGWTTLPSHIPALATPIGFGGAD